MSTGAAGPRVLVGFDGTPAAVAAVEIGALLLPTASAVLLDLWTPPFAGEALRRRVGQRARTVDELLDLVELEGAAEAERTVHLGAVVSEAAGWTASTRVARSYGGDGLRFAEIARETGAELVLLGSRGLSGMPAVLDSVTDLVVRHSPVPVLVVPHPMLTDERARVATGPVVVGWDGSPGALRALRGADSVLPGRPVVAVSVGEATAPPADPGSGPAAGVRRVAEPAPLPGPARAVARELLRVASEEGAAVLAVGSRGRPGWQDALGSTTLAVLHHAHLPVLVLPARVATTGAPAATDAPSNAPG
ncbi:universal stress protein [Pseudonocardia spirodelae]|uniref:Universal stress protein n=1 Tax=Pseudonocardia spirodelae TaxID=3133431 RepID=A0ABU8T2K9_9PSEU